MDAQSIIQFGYSYQKLEQDLVQLTQIYDRWLEARDSGDESRIKNWDERLGEAITRVVGRG